MEKPEEGCTHDEYGLLAVYSRRSDQWCTPDEYGLLLLQQRESLPQP
jgi:hypothetical protein